MEHLTAAMPAITLKPLLDERRTIANKRERERVQSLRGGFHDLAEVVPKDDAEPQLTRIDVVRRAKDYIAYLANLLESDQEGKTPVTVESDAESTCTSKSTSNCNELRASFLDYRVECNELTRLPENRVKCNERARNRSRQTKHGFTQLKDLVPIHPAEAELSRIEVLRRATEYIAFMATLLGDSEMADYSLPPLASSEVSSTADNVSVDCVSLLCSPDTGASFSSTTASPADSLSLDLTNVGISPPDFDSDYASMSPPSSTASDCSFTFPSIAHTTISSNTTMSIMSTSNSTQCITTTITRPHSSLARSSSHPYAPCSPRPYTHHVYNAAAPSERTYSKSRSFLRRERRSFSDTDIADIELESFLNDQTTLALSSCTDAFTSNWSFLEHLPTAVV